MTFAFLSSVMLSFMCIIQSEQEGKTAIDLAHEKDDDRVISMILKVSYCVKRTLFNYIMLAYSIFLL